MRPLGFAERVSDGVCHRQSTQPFDVVGRAACLCPDTFNVSDYEPITERIPQPPPVHQVFGGEHFVICNLVPRKVDHHPLSNPVPYRHSIVDSDEVMFDVGEDYEARNVGHWAISMHPGGHAHGPEPDADDRSIGADRFDELVVMADTVRPLELGEVTLACEHTGYGWTWVGREPQS